MSYILEALRKSEAERRQGKAPDLGHSVQMIHQPRRKPVSLLVWIVLGLFLNAGILGYVFWPEIQAAFAPEASEPSAEDVVPETPPTVSVAPVQAQPEVPEHGEPTIIVPRAMAQQQELTATRSQGRVPHLVELPLSFQKSIPDLTFNSRIVSSNSSASSVMINSQYLRAGDSMGSLLIEQINEDGVVFRKDGQQFRVGTMRNWVSPR